MTLPTKNTMRERPAYEIHFLVHSAVSLREIIRKDKARSYYSAWIQVENTLGFTNPTNDRLPGVSLYLSTSATICQPLAQILVSR